MLAVIGGSGLTQLADLKVERREIVRTPWGEPSGALTFGRIGCRDVVFLPRHGHGHTIPPHRVNYRANLWALAQAAKAEGVVSVASVGGIGSRFAPGTMVVPDQLVDYTWGRQTTFHENGEGEVVHIDFTEPYDRELRGRLLAAAQRAGDEVVDGAVYGATQGPRLETAAEINRMERDGCDLVGMTGMPEAALARELGLPYAALCVVANWAAGRGDSTRTISMSAIEEVLQRSMIRARHIIGHLCA